MNNVIEFFGKPEAWRCIIGVITACGVAISAEQASAIIAAGIALMGAVGMFTAKKTEPKE